MGTNRNALRDWRNRFDPLVIESLSIKRSLSNVLSVALIVSDYNDYFTYEYVYT